MPALALLIALLSIDPNAGTTGFDFLKIPPTAREAAMGGAVLGGAAVDGGQSPLAFWYSPALSAASETPRAQVGYMNYVAGIRAGSVAYNQPLSPGRGVALGIVYLNSGTMKRTNELGEEQGTFGSSFADLNLGGATEVASGLTIGLGVQGLYGSIDTFFSLGLAGNLGAVYRLPVNGLSAGLAVRNLGYQVKAFRVGRDPMATDVGIGLAYEPNPSLDLALDVHKPIDDRVNVRLGIEGRIGDVLILRGGYNSTGSDLESGGGWDILAGVATGLGIRYRGYQLDYCFIPMVTLGTAHRISLTFSL